MVYMYVKVKGKTQSFVSKKKKKLQVQQNSDILKSIFLISDASQLLQQIHIN